MFQAASQAFSPAPSRLFQVGLNEDDRIFIGQGRFQQLVEAVAVHVVDDRGPEGRPAAGPVPPWFAGTRGSS